MSVDVDYITKETQFERKTVEYRFGRRQGQFEVVAIFEPDRELMVKALRVLLESPDQQDTSSN